MIGMMNAGSDSQVEFYNALRQSSLYERKPSKDSRTYTAEGRVFINGVPVYQETAEEMWHDVIHRVVAEKMIKSIHPRPSGALSVFRRFSSKLRPLTRVTSNDSKKTGEPGENPHLTVIRIDSMNRNSVNRTRDPSTFSENGRILNRLLEESEMMEKRAETDRGDISEQYSHTDSGHASLEETAMSPPKSTLVERF